MLNTFVTQFKDYDQWNINRGGTPAEGHWLTGRLHSARKVAFQHFLLSVLILGIPDMTRLPQSPWPDCTSLSWVCCSVKKERCPDVCWGFGDVSLGKFKPLSLQMCFWCFVFPPRTMCVTAGVSLAAVPQSGGQCIIGLLLGLDRHLLLSWKQSRDPQMFPGSGYHDPSVWKYRT